MNYSHFSNTYSLFSTIAHIFLRLTFSKKNFILSKKLLFSNLPFPISSLTLSNALSLFLSHSHFFQRFLTLLHFLICHAARNTKGGSITVPITSRLTGLDESVLHIKTKIVSRHTAYSEPVKQEVNGTVILPPFSIPWSNFLQTFRFCACLSFLFDPSSSQWMGHDNELKVGFFCCWGHLHSGKSHETKKETPGRFVDGSFRRITFRRPLIKDTVLPK